MADNNLTIQVQADNTKLQADLAVTKELFRQAAREVRDTAKEAAAGGDRQPLQDAVAQYAELGGRVKFLQGAIAATKGEHQGFLGTLREAGTGLRELGARALEFGVVLREVGDRIFPHFREIAALSLAGAAAEFVHLATEAASGVRQIENQARTLDVSTEAMEGFNLVASQAGVDQERFFQALAISSRRIGELREEAVKLTGQLPGAVTTLRGGMQGIADAANVARGSVHRLNESIFGTVQVARGGGEKQNVDFGKAFADIANDPALNTQERQIAIAERLTSLKDKTIQAALAQHEYGRSWREVIPALIGIRDRLKEADEEIHKSGLGLEDSEKTQARVFNASLATMKFYIERVKSIFGIEFGKALAPVFDEVKRFLTTNSGDIRRWAAEAGATLKNVSMDFIDLFRAATGTGSAAPQLRTDFARNFVAAKDAVVAAVRGIRAGFVALNGTLDLTARGFNAVFGTNFSGIGLGITAAVFGMAGGFRLLAPAVLLASRAFLFFLTNPVGLVLTAIGLVALTIYQNWDKIGPVIQGLWDKFQQFGAWVRDQLASAFNAAWEAAVSGIKTVLGWVDTLLQKLSKALNFVKSLGGSAGPGDLGDSITAGAAAGGLPGGAGGGWIHGPGTGTSDSVLIRASAGEHVTNERQASRFRPLLDAINSGSLAVRGFAEGGWIGEAFSGLMPHASIPAYAGGGRVSSDGGSLHLHIGDRSYEARAPQRTLEDLATAARYSDTVSLGRKPSTMYGSR